MAEYTEAFVCKDYVPLPPHGMTPGARWGDTVSDVEEEEEATAAADGEDEFETDPKRLTARQQQIDFGKNTLGYERYLQAVPKHKRKLRGKDHDPPTPDITKKMSKRTWDGIVKAWRRHLHKFDDMEAPKPAAGGSNAADATEMQVDAAPAMDDAPRAAAAAGGKRRRGAQNKRCRSKQQNNNSSSQHARQDDTSSQPRQQQQQQQDEECGQQQGRHSNRLGDSREEENCRGRGHGSGGSTTRRHHHSSSSGRDYGQPPRHSRQQGRSSSRGSGHKSSSHTQQQQLREPQDGAGAVDSEAGRGSPDCAAAVAGGDLAGGSSRQLTPAKRRSNSQGDLDTRPAKHC